jgi:predicted MPP superfamily phosphohydrolase
MSAAFNPLVFRIIATLVLLGLHAYLYWRVTHYLGGSARTRLWLRGALLLLLLLITAMGMPQSTNLPRNLSLPLVWLAFSWMGLLLMAVPVFAILHLLGGLARRAAPQPERRALLRRLAGLGGLGGTAALAGAGLYQAARPVAVHELPVTLKKLPPELDGLRIAQITDVHIGPILDGEWLTALVQKTNALAADIIVITGDMVDGPIHLLREQLAPLQQLRASGGVYFVTGNHEYISSVNKWLELFTGFGIHVLRNERLTLHPRGGSAALDIAGVDDYAGSRVHGHGPDFAKALAGRDPARTIILLAHQPRAVHEAARRGVDLQLSGHTHGGQILPWGYMAYLLQPYVVGLHRYPDSDTQVYVSPGTGYWGPPMRLGTAAEITHITLRSGMTA